MNPETYIFTFGQYKGLSYRELRERKSHSINERLAWYHFNTRFTLPDDELELLQVDILKVNTARRKRREFGKVNKMSAR